MGMGSDATVDTGGDEGSVVVVVAGAAETTTRASAARHETGRGRGAGGARGGKPGAVCSRGAGGDRSCRRPWLR